MDRSRTFVGGREAQKRAYMRAVLVVPVAASAVLVLVYVARHLKICFGRRTPFKKITRTGD